MKSRRAVGGLISMIGLIVVFGIAGVAFLSLNAQQTSLFSAQQRVNEIQHDRNVESFEGKVLRCKDVIIDQKAQFIEIRINNTSTQQLELNSFILYSIQYQNITSTNYTNPKITIPPHMSTKFNLTGITYDLNGASSIQDHSTRIIMLSDLGNKIFLDHDFLSNCADP